MKPTLVLVHGWGFAPSFWEPLRATPVLASLPTLAVDLGFFGAAPTPLPEGVPLVGVGHSLGFSWLLRQDLPWRGLVSINGFARFVAGPDFPAGVHPRLLDRMRKRFAEAPEVVVSDFLRRCGVETPTTEGMDVARLAEGLDWLASGDEREALASFSGPCLALADREDPIVPEALSRASAFSALRWSEGGGGHLLPLRQPTWCAEAIARFVEELP